jgi:hypothetical protein
MNRWIPKVWEPDGHHSAHTQKSEYERLHTLAHKRGLFVFLRREKTGELALLGLSNGLGVELSDISELDSAARKLRGRLAREVSR